MDEANFIARAPGPHSSRWLEAGRLDEGNRFPFEETIHGQHPKRTVWFTRTVPNRVIEDAPDNRGAHCFRMGPLAEGFRFAQRLHIRTVPSAAGEPEGFCRGICGRKASVRRHR
jgi:hypothetical protein